MLEGVEESTAVIDSSNHGQVSHHVIKSLLFQSLHPSPFSSLSSALISLQSEQIADCGDGYHCTFAEEMYSANQSDIMPCVAVWVHQAGLGVVC
jgi:hypothetical protein